MPRSLVQPRSERADHRYGICLSPLPHPCRTKVVMSRSRPGPRDTRSGGLDRLASYGAIPYRWSGYSRSRSTGVTTWMGSWPRSRMSSQPPDHKYGIDRPTSPELTAGMGSRASGIGLNASGTHHRTGGSHNTGHANRTYPQVRADGRAERSGHPIPLVMWSHSFGHPISYPRSGLSFALIDTSIGSICRVSFIVSEGSKEPGNQTHGSHTESQQFIPYQRSGFDLQTETTPCISTETR
jgi:hypothetical protein